VPRPVRAGPLRRPAAAPRREMHDAADGVGAEDRALRAADDLDPLDVAERQEAEVEAAAEAVRADAVYQDQRVVRLASAREDRGQRAASAAAAHGEAWRRAQRVGHRLELAGAQRAGVDDRGRRGRLRPRPRHRGGGDDDRFGDRRDVQADLEQGRVRGRPHGAGRGGKARHVHQHPVARVGEAVEREAPVGVGRGRPHAERAVHQDGRARYGASGRIDDAAGDGGGVSGARRREEQYEKGEQRNGTWTEPGPTRGSHVHSFRRAIAPRERDGPATRSPDSRIRAQRPRLPMPCGTVASPGAGAGKGVRSPLTVAAPCGNYTQLRLVRRASVCCAAEYSMSDSGLRAAPCR
jgi:hypothetical protein